MKRFLPLIFGTVAAMQTAAAEMPRPPAVPLVACDPYFSIWSQHDKLYDGTTTHWTGKDHRLSAYAVIDGKTLRLLGNENRKFLPMPQTDLEVTPTRTLATFDGSGVTLEMTFTTPALPDDLAILSRPVTYLDFKASSNDGAEHEVQITFTASSEIAANLPDQKTDVEVLGETGDLRVLRAGTVAQPILAKRGDDLRIDWGHLYLAAPAAEVSEFDVKASKGKEAAEQSLSLEFDFGTVGSDSVSRWLMLAYDQIYAIRYMSEDLRPYWRKDGWEALDLLQASAAEHESLLARCAEFDKELLADLTAAGGEDYAYIASLAYREAFAAGKFVADANGQPLQFSKENNSNGCIATSDVFYPMAPQFLLFGPSLAKSFIVPFMNYAVSARWKFPFAPHDLGTYPHANGQVYGGGERSEENQMPVEESGNLLILFGAVAQMEGNADFAGLYWETLTRWAEDLKGKGLRSREPIEHR